MSFLPAVLSFVAAAALLSLAGLHVVKGEQRPQKLLFIAMTMVLGAAQTCQGLLLLQTDPEVSLFWLQVLAALSIFFPAVASPFFLVFGKRDEIEMLRRRLSLVFLGLVVAGAAALLIPVRVLVSEVHFAEGVFWGLTVTDWGKTVAVFVVATNVLYLFLIENTYRAASIPEKVTLKYPMLGIVTASLVTLVVVSRILAISILDRNFLAVQSAGLLAMCSSLFFATMRYRLFDVKVYVGRQVASSIISVSIAGAYLIALAVVSYLAGLLGVSYDILTLQVVVVFALFLIVAVLLSGRARRRIRRFVNENFYLNRFDYRAEWRQFAHVMASSDRLEVYLSNFASALCESMMAQRGMIWVEDDSATSGTSGSVSAYGMRVDGRPECIDSLDALQLTPGEARLIAVGEIALGVDDSVHAVAALGSGERTIGYVVLGTKSMDLTYTEEDRDFIAMLADQATIAIENYKLEETLIDSRQMETFNRLASFVVHDLKNTVGMLSMTADNARDNIGDREFQKDAIETIRRSVTKMQSLIDSLSALENDPELRTETVDLAQAVRGVVTALKSVADARGLSIDLAELPDMTVDADASAVERIVENLVYNALDASRAGGAVRVVARPGRRDQWALDVIDDGAGFDPEYLRTRLYRPFQTTKKEGLGVGLLMCKTLAVALGGDIEIASEPGRGATVTLMLPALVSDN